jgi:hypothetical protein
VGIQAALEIIAQGQRVDHLLQRGK